MPRRSKLTPELIETAAKLVSAGNYLSHVAQYLGVHEDTFYRWLKEGEKAKGGLKRQFYEAIKKAEAEAIARNVTLIQKAAQDGNWQAAAWWLERRYPDEWGKRDKMDIRADGGLVIKIIEVGDDDADDDGSKSESD